MANIQAAERAKVPTGGERERFLKIDNSPLPPAAEMAQIQAIDPSLVGFVKDELKKQYEAQRQIVMLRDKTVRHLNIAGLYLGALIALFG